MTSTGPGVRSATQRQDDVDCHEAVCDPGGVQPGLVSKTFPRWGCVRKNWVTGSMRSPYEGSLPAVRKHHDAGFVCYMDGLEVVRLTMTRLISKVKEFLRRRVTKKLGGGKTNDS